MVQPLDWRLMTEATFRSKATEQDGRLDEYEARVESIETLGGIAPGDASDATVKAHIVQHDSQTRSALKAAFVGKGELVTNARDYIKADGVTADDAGLLNAFTTGRVINLPAGSTIAVGTRFDLPAGKTIIANGATIKGLPATANGNFVLGITGDTKIVGHLIVETADAGNVRAVEISGSNVVIDALTTKAPTPGSSAGNLRNTGLTIASNNVSNVSIGRLSIENFDWAARIERSAGVTIGHYSVKSYIQGLYIMESRNVTIQSGHIRTTSPNDAANTEGNNGVLIESLTHDGTRNIRLDNMTVEDSGGHGHRLGGQFRISNVWYNNCLVSNAGSSGFKALGGTTAANNYHENIYYTDCIAEDCGALDGNDAGFLIQYVRNGAVTNPIVRKKNKPYSAYAGVRINRCTNVTVNHPILQDTLNSAYRVDPELGAVDDVILNGGIIRSSTGNGFTFNYTGTTFRRVSVTGKPTVEITGAGYCLSIVNTGGGIISTPAEVEFRSSSPVGNILDGGTGTNYAGYISNITARMPANPGFANGSKWTDQSAGISYNKHSGKWKMVNAAGSTSNRPAVVSVGDQYFDETLLKPVWVKSINPNVWVDAMGSVV